jgi:hypothetical protein
LAEATQNASISDKATNFAYFYSLFPISAVKKKQKNGQFMPSISSNHLQNDCFSPNLRKLLTNYLVTHSLHFSKDGDFYLCLGLRWLLPNFPVWDQMPM